ncbi:MAG: aldose epimerase family protein [Verrucomicrobiota bacterium]|jgi:aldose 1-epimerase
MKASIQKTAFGKLPDGTAVELYTLKNANGLVAKITNYGTIITELHVPGRNGKLGDIVLGFDNLPQYLKGHPYFGCTVGRVANRIAKGRFTLDGKVYTLALNNRPNHLHGGLKGFDKVLWQAQPQPGAGAVKFAYTSPAGQEGYPGTLAVTVTMSLTDANELRIDYTATTDHPTPVNLTNHSYFNLAGQGDVLAHELMLAADHYTPANAELIPTGQIKPVKGTPMDFTRPQPIGARFSQLSGYPVGYDNNFVLNGGGKTLALAARLYEPKSGRVMELSTTAPGLQLYTANFLDGSLTGKYGIVYRRHSALCLETQHFPNSVNQVKFPSIILRPGQTYRHTTVHKFAVQ